MQNVAYLSQEKLISFRAFFLRIHRTSNPIIPNKKNRSFPDIGGSFVELEGRRGRLSFLFGWCK